MKIELKQVEFHNPHNDGKSGVYYFNNEKYAGVVYEEFHGYVASEFEIKDGLQDGYEKCFYPDGKIESNIEFKKGLEDGLAIYYSEEGVITEKLFFEKGIELWSEVYEDGETVERNEIDQDSTSFIVLERLRVNNN